MKTIRLLIVPLLLSFVLFSVPRQVWADEYDDSQSHPLRVVGYAAHPVGVLLEWFILRPLHAIVSTQAEGDGKGLDYLFGHKPHPPIFAEGQPAYDFGVMKRVPMGETTRPKMAVPQEPTAERVTVKEVSVEKEVLKEVPKIVEVEKIVFPDVAFRFDSAELTDLGKGKVYLAAQKLKEKSEIVVAIEGHADYIGSDEYNQRLGFRRAETVMKELAQLGVEPTRMSAASFGASKPVVDEKTDWARAVNRRVEFRVAAP